MTIFATVAQTLTPDIVDRIARSVDEPVEKTQRAIDSLVHTLVGGLLKRTMNDIGVGQLFGQLKKGQFTGQFATELPVILNDPARTNALIARGDDAVSHLLPAMKSSIGSMISSYAGIRNSSAIALLGLTTAVMLDELGRQTADKKMDAIGLATLLHEQREEFIAAVPDDLMPRLVDKLGLQQLVAPPVVPGNRRSAAAPVAAPASVAATPRLAESRPAPAIPVSYAAEPEPETGSALVRWGGGALVLLVLLGIGFMVWRNNQSAPAYNTETSGATEADSLGADTIARSMAVPTDPNAPAASTPTGPPAAPATELTTSINAYLADTSAAVGRTFPLTAVSFLPGSSSFVAGADVIITDLVNLLRTHPTAQIRLVGYANDASGNLTNKQLSVRRVNAIKQQLVDAGINFIRVDALGLGSGAKKVVLNDSTTVTRGPSLRKIDLKIVVK